MIPQDTQTVYEVFASACQKHGKRPILNVLSETASVYGIEAGEITYAQAMDRVEAWANAFADAGYDSGMRVALLLENRPDFFLIWLALNKIGASVVPVNPDLRAAELEYLIGHAEPALIITVQTRIGELQAAADTAGVDVQAIAIGDAVPAPRADAVVAASADHDFDRETAVLYTSGTTGNPKGCVLANSYFLEVGRWYSTLDGIVSLTEDGERMITPLPIFHMNAMAYSFMAMITLGGCLTAVDRFHPRSWWQDVRDSKATCLHYLGVMPSMLMTAEPSPADRNHSVRFGFGAGVDPQLHAVFEERFGFPLTEAWAMTETGAGAVISNHTDNRVIGKAALGRAPDFLDILLADDDGNPVPEGQPGELLVRRKGGAPRLGFFSEYYKNPEATEEAWENGWFHTGDIVRQGEDGYFFFVDRKKNVIRRSGENIAAVEVESILMRHPEISAAAVAPVPDPIRGDEVFACLKVANPGEDKAQEIVTWALGQMAYYKVPGYIAFVEKLPLTATQKIQRAELKTMAAALLADTGTYNTTKLKKRQVA
ncbi:AMP-binding protein [Labrenzia sp. PHM005]|uniref:AMP-binding protein n=1 Tax=Labrenzia sp. PHM005 TaxID=2590016 RepID=UPI0011406D03|nr:AMP-binding protein [Labrenzia sp. PHM005]QDG76295.1 ATP-dependent acyl-CoA ligase [Labrenzia sp. PHM005]